MIPLLPKEGDYSFAAIFSRICTRVQEVVRGAATKLVGRDGEIDAAVCCAMSRRPICTCVRWCRRSDVVLLLAFSRLFRGALVRTIVARVCDCGAVCVTV